MDLKKNSSLLDFKFEYDHRLYMYHKAERSTVTERTNMLNFLWIMNAVFVYGIQ